jgi:hypothetical protein
MTTLTALAAVFVTLLGTAAHEDATRHDEHEVFFDEPSTMQATAPRTIEKGDQSNVDSAVQALVRTDAEWAALYRKHNFDRQPPKVEFAREMVIAVFMGSRPTAGYTISIISALEVKGTMIVRYTESMPKPGSMTAQIITSPYHIVGIPTASVTDVKFEKVVK